MSTTNKPVSVDDLTLEEQVTLLAGQNFCEVAGIERLGVRSLKVSDGPNGARGAGSFTAGTPAASFPVGISLASTWNTELIGRIGIALAQEANSKGVQVILGPTVNIHRHPLGGRNFESFSEDPFLAGQIGIAYVSALQAGGVAASLKHFTGNESEFERNSINSVIGERALRELYLRPFEMIVRGANPWTVMCSYPKVNGTFASENHRLLTEILRDEWGFDGVVMSDWTATKSTGPAIEAGLDLEMPGPTKWRGAALVAAANSGEVSRSAIRKSADRMLRLLDRTAGAPSVESEQAIDRPEHRALIREAGAQGIVLLENNGLLPLDPARGLSIAVIGPNSDVAQIMGGGSSQINAHYRISPLDGIRAAVPEGTVISHARGCLNTRLLAVHHGESRVEIFSNTDFAGAPDTVQTAPEVDFLWLGFIHPGVSIANLSMRLTTSVTAEESGTYEIGAVSAGPFRVLVDGQVVVDHWDDWERGGEFFGLVSKEKRGSLDMVGGTAHEVVIETRSTFTPPLAGIWMLRLGFDLADHSAEIDQAIAIASSSDLAVVFVGLNGEWDTEGYDRPHMDLPGRQNELVARVAAVNPNTVVVLQTGGPVRMPWLDDVAAVLQAWYPGQECGNAIADVLFGEVNPSGRLPSTWPYEVEHNPAHLGYPGERGRVEYREGIFGGYRWYDARKIDPQYPFGFGRSYTTFAYDTPTADSVSINRDGLTTVSITVTNTGTVAGAEVVQVYVVDAETEIERPARELKGFSRVELQPGESNTVSIPLDMRAFACFDDVRNAWVAGAGEFHVQFGASSRDIRAELTLHLESEWVEVVSDVWMSRHI